MHDTPRDPHPPQKKPTAMTITAVDETAADSTDCEDPPTATLTAALYRDTLFLTLDDEQTYSVDAREFRRGLDSIYPPPRPAPPAGTLPDSDSQPGMDAMVASFADVPPESDPAG
jgi:hypothetical protein